MIFFKFISQRSSYKSPLTDSVHCLGHGMFSNDLTTGSRVSWWSIQDLTVTASDRAPSKVSWIQFQFQRSVYVIDPLSRAVAKFSAQVKSSTFLNANFEILNISQLHYRV